MVFLVSEAVQHIRINYRWQVIDEENQAIERAHKKTGNLFYKNSIQWRNYKTTTCQKQISSIQKEAA